MTDLLERPEVKEAPNNLVVERALPEAPVRKEPTPPPAPRRGVRWIRWMIAAVALVVVAAAVVVVVDSGQDAGVVGTSHPLADISVLQVEPQTNHPLTQIYVPVNPTGAPITAGHPLAEVFVPEAAFVSVEGIDGVYVPSTLSGTTQPLGEVVAATVAAVPADGYVPSTLSGSTNPYTASAPLAATYELADYYVPSTLTGSTNPVGVSRVPME